MFVRLSFCKFAAESIQEARKIYRNQIVPEVKKQKGNIGVRLLEPAEKSDDFISITEWKTKADADAYETSGHYKELVGLLGGLFTKPPVLKVYEVEDMTVASAVL